MEDATLQRNNLPACAAIAKKYGAQVYHKQTEPLNAWTRNARNSKQTWSTSQGTYADDAGRLSTQTQSNARRAAPHTVMIVAVA